MPDAPSAADLRHRFLDERREICRQRFDTLHAPVYDDRWGGYVNATHAVQARALISRLSPGATVLDAACGTGKYWPMLIEAGLVVTGTDQSQAMLDVAAAKHPEVVTRRIALQELAASDLTGFDGVLCIDAVENVGPEDWPLVVAGLHQALRPGGAAYLTVELPDDDAALDDIDAPLVEGEVISGGAYHYYPRVEDATAMVRAGGFDVDTVTEGDGYVHFLLSR